MVKNPGHKSSLREITAEIQQVCHRFNNEASALKVHLPKVAAAKSRGKRKAPSVKSEDETGAE